jgi:hypothetical protein
MSDTLWSSWYNQAKDLAGKAQVIAEAAGKIAHEKATEIAKQAQDLRQNYDMEVFLFLLTNNTTIL